MIRYYYNIRIERDIKMHVQAIKSINFKSYLPSKKDSKTDGWDELERLCKDSPEQKAMLYNQLKLLSENGDKNILTLEHTPKDFSFRLYKNEENIKKDKIHPYMIPQNHLNKEILVDLYGDHTYKVSYGQLYSIKQHEQVQKEKANILLKILRDIVAIGTKENSAIFGKANLKDLPNEIVANFRLKI